MKRNLLVGTAVITLAVALGAGSAWLGKRTVVAAAGEQAPKFEVDPFWPKPMPNGWCSGRPSVWRWMRQDNVWIVHRPGSLEAEESYQTRKEADCCTAAPDVLAFDQAGNLIPTLGQGRRPRLALFKPRHHHRQQRQRLARCEWRRTARSCSGQRGTVRGRRGARCSSPTRRPGRLADVGARGRRGFAGQATYHDSFILKFSKTGQYLGQIGHANGSKGSMDNDTSAAWPRSASIRRRMSSLRPTATAITASRSGIRIR